MNLVHAERERGRSLKRRSESRGAQRDHSCTVSVFLYLYLIATWRQLFQFPRRNAVYKTETRLENKTQKQEVVHHPSDGPFWHHYHLPAVCGEISGATVSVWRRFIESLSPLLLSGLWSVLASLFSRWGTVVGSGVGLVLQLFSCFTGDESAMELWLLLSSEPPKKRQKVESLQALFSCIIDKFGFHDQISFDFNVSVFLEDAYEVWLRELILQVI